MLDSTNPASTSFTARVEEPQSVEEGATELFPVSMRPIADLETAVSPSNPAADEDLPWLSRYFDIWKKYPYTAITAFGGPAMGIMLLRERFVKQHKWIEESTFNELFSMTQGFPGPAQALLATAIGTARAGLPGGFTALFIYSLPGFIIMLIIGEVSHLMFDPSGGTPDWMAGFGPAAICFIFIATFRLFTSLVVNNRLKIFVCLMSSMATILATGDSRVMRSPWATMLFPCLLLAGAFLCVMDSRRSQARYEVYQVAPSLGTKQKQAESLTEEEANALKVRVEHDRELVRRRANMTRWKGCLLLSIWFSTLVTVLTLKAQNQLGELGLLFETFFRVGTLIFGGGYVVIPLLLNENLVPRTQFFQGFAIVQALPGPLFNFSAFIGSIRMGVPGAFVCALGLFLPGALLMLGMWPFWIQMRNLKYYRPFMAGVSSAAIGFVVSACVDLWDLAIVNPACAVVILATGTANSMFNVPAPIAIVGGILLGFILSPTCLNLGQERFGEQEHADGSVVVFP